jgi:hypothetical protein
LPRQTDTLALTAKYLEVSKKDFVVKEPLKYFSISLFPRPFSQKRGEVRSGVFIKVHAEVFLISI